MMWNFLVGGLLAGAAVVLYDGQPDPHGLWEFAAQAGVTSFGTSAGFIAACMKAGVRPPALPELRSVGSTGSPLPVEGFEWVYENVGDVWLFSTSGGTDLCTAFVGACPVLPVRAGELQARALGASVEAWDEDGRPLVDEVGELVITKPMPSMPLFLWNDPDGERYRESYFDMYPGVWRHGDWIKITARGSAVIYGRSDSTINRGGVRMGTSELYSAVEGVDAVLDSLVVDVDDRIVLFVVTSDELDEAARAELRAPRARALLTAARARRDPPHRRGAAHALQQEARGAGQAHPPGRRPGQGGEPRLARQPSALDWFAERAELLSVASRGAELRADLGVEALGQLRAEALRPGEHALVHAPGRVVEPLAAGDRDRRQAGGPRGVGVAGGPADERTGAEALLRVVVLDDLLAQRQQLVVRPDRDQRALAAGVAHVAGPDRVHVEDDRAVRRQVVAQSRNARMPAPPAFWAPVKTTCTREVLERVRAEALREAEHRGRRPEALSSSPRAGAGEGHVEQQRDRGEQRDRGHELDDVSGCPVEAHAGAGAQQAKTPSSAHRSGSRPPSGTAQERARGRRADAPWRRSARGRRGRRRSGRRAAGRRACRRRRAPTRRRSGRRAAPAGAAAVGTCSRRRARSGSRRRGRARRPRPRSRRPARCRPPPAPRARRSRAASPDRSRTTRSPRRARAPRAALRGARAARRSASLPGARRPSSIRASSSASSSSSPWAPSALAPSSS